MNIRSADFCKICGRPFPKGERSKEIRETKGQLTEVEKKRQKQAEKINRAREQGKAQDLESLIELGKKRGYNSPEKWAVAIMQARAEKYAKYRKRHNR